MPNSKPSEPISFEFKPDCERECGNCGQSPVVTAIDATGL